MLLPAACRELQGAPLANDLAREIRSERFDQSVLNAFCLRARVRDGSWSSQRLHFAKRQHESWI